MSGVDIELGGAALHLRASGVLYWPTQSLLCVSDLHLGKSERIARRGGTLLPPYDTLDTLQRLEAEIDALAPSQVVCLGDSFDDLTAADALGEEAHLWISKLQAGRDWIWIEGNHDAGPVDLGGTHRSHLKIDGLTFRHIAQSSVKGTSGRGTASQLSKAEVSGHYHPKARIALRGKSVSRPCFAFDRTRLVLPAFGAYTGGLWTSDLALSRLFGAQAKVALTGRQCLMFPMPR